MTTGLISVVELNLVAVAGRDLCGWGIEREEDNTEIETKVGFEG